jgi:hypothetical protein
MPWVQYKPGRYILVKDGEAPAPRKPRVGIKRESVSMGVDPSQVAANVAFNKAHGVRPTDYSADGCPVFNSLRHEAEYSRARGWHNRDGVMG